MELIEGRKAKEERRLPKNIRQIGEPGQGAKVLIEDYVYTFLHQLVEENLTCIRTAILVGKVDGEMNIYIQGALEVDMGQDIKHWFSHEHWRNIFRDVQEWFEDMEVVGWCMANPGFPTVLTDELRNLHQRNFSGEQYVFFQMDVIENEEIFYICMENGLAPLCGYYIYYEKNDRMQTYMSQRRGGAGIEHEGILKDQATARFRNVMQEKKEQSSQKRVLAFLYTSCTFLVMVILVIGITMVNNYDRMANMENAIHQISESLEGEEEAPQSVEPEMIEEAVEEVQETLEEPEPVVEEVPEEVQPVMSEAVVEPESYQIRPGDTLLEISRAKYGTEDMVDKICEVNDLEDGDIIYVGQTIVLP